MMAAYYLEDQIEHDQARVKFYSQRVSRTQLLEPPHGTNITDATIRERLRLAASNEDPDHDVDTCLVCSGVLNPIIRPT